MAPEEPTAPPWHTRSAEAAATALRVDPALGLDAAEAAARLARLGPNTLPEGPRRSVSRMVLDQFSDFMILVLIAAAVVSGLIGDAVDTVAIVVIVVLNAAIGFFQEWRAERAMAALKRLAAPSARVRRGGVAATLPAEQLVPGDVVLLEAGNVVPADLRLIEAARLQVAEAALTGESQPVHKTTAALEESAAPLGDRSNMAFKGTLVSYGRGAGLVAATGLDTELGRIARLLAGAEEVKTPLQKRLAAFGTRLAWAVLVICAIVFAAGLLRGEPPVLMFLTAVSLAVAAIPEALPAVVTISLALGAHRLVRQNALIRRLPAVETLGSITYICSDKTGTLTENRMRVEALRVAGGDAPGAPPAEPWASFFRALALNNDASLDAAGRSLGDPTETALLEAARQAGFDKAAEEARAPRIAELPFDSERKRMATLHREATRGSGALAAIDRRIAPGAALPQDNAVVAYVKGAPESVLPRCLRQLTPDGPAPLDAVEVLSEAERMAAQGLRVLAVARREFAAAPARLEEAEEELTLLGLVGLMDPPRAEAAQAVAECRAAGIVPVMITGDHPATARAIARRLGILGEGDAVMTGAELGALSDAAFAARVKSVRVYARVDPEQKIRIVKALQAAGEFAAMTGDGVNDAPALKRADIGVAMGRGGTDVAREAAHMVLLDDNFATIVAAVREGRRIFDNIRKFIKYTMTSNSGEIWTIFLAPFLGLPIPLLPIHILWINLVTDGLPGLALAKEPGERDLMARPPRPPRESIFAHGMWQHIVWVGLTMGAVCLLLQAWAWHTGSAHWQTMVFTVLTLSQLGHVLAIRSERESLFAIGLGSNPMLLAAVALTVLLQLATIYVPALNPIFKTEPLSAGELAVALALSSVVFFAVEVEKWLVRRGTLYAAQ
ncbi:MAG: cation-translocating P-type ATPase [Rhodocyclales bacterium]|nr:cation-translocating P-type ATPase [Rhodocyclales bacterium]